MKLAAPLAALAALLLAGPAGASRLLRRARDDGSKRAITQVVNLLEEMLEKSQAEGVKERELFAKHKCYCDDNEEAKTSRIQELDTQIQLLAAQIEEIQSKTGELSVEAADLKDRMEDNVLKREKLTSIRDKENQAFLDRSGELNVTEAQLKEALSILSAIGANQELAAQGHVQQMAGYQLAQVQRALRQASITAATLGEDGHAKKLSAFLQATTGGKAPFTGTYSTQSGEIFGILADMRDNCEKELSEITAQEAAALAAYNAITADLLAEYGEMETREGEVQTELSGNDEDLDNRKSLKEADEAEKADAEAFLEQLRELCTEKAAQYEKRVALRTNEETAIAQAIAILNSDMAFEAFGKVAATSTGTTGARLLQTRKVGAPSLLQLRGRRGALVVGSAARRLRAEALLRRAASSRHSLRAARVEALLEAENPFETVLEEIKKMLALIEEEGEMDTDKKAWCDKTQEEKNAALQSAKEEITGLEFRISELDSNIAALKIDIKSTEDSLVANTESQTSETAERKEVNLAYQKNIENLVNAEGLLTKAVVVLKAYYEETLSAGAAGTGLLQRSKEEPAPPGTWTEFKGQSEGGTDAVSMLEFILTNTKAEETEAHSAEDQDQRAYEEEMTGLKAEQATLQETLAAKQVELTTAEEELLVKKKDLKTMLDLEAEIKAYLLSIKPGCDFMDQNLALREQSRLEEANALTGARDLLMETPAYQEAVAAAHNETLGDCKDICAINEAHVDCLACVSKVSVPGYCAGHPTALGCA
mmetsp:Transcript_97764/g.258195  ORF Transcript_97764/g.258195 Transcript_97764/m.258195 type:complete len:768 (+) Transcript_97764:90-2393(+)